ncbi:MAG TPA: glycosyl transferase family 1, partial [Candidatus Omnitrophota bacterium]|nr:glycosyl transferase family 1 [Candidatus Omnitrophota bacterium]
MPKLADYISVVTQPVIDDLRLLADKLRGKVIRNINSTAVGGGVAEILNRMVPFLQELGIDAHWDVIKGGERFFAVTKKIHNALHGATERITDDDLEVFIRTSKDNMAEMDLSGDIIFVHDPQPIAL